MANLNWAEYLATGVPEDPTPEGYDPENIFAKILSGEIPSYKVLETAHCYVMLDAFPVARFHCLLLPKRPSIDVSDLSPDAAAGFLKELPRVVAAVKKASGAPAVKVLSNAGTAAGQVLYEVVFHTHFHVIPRFNKGDSLDGASTMVDSEEAAESVRLLRVNLETDP